MLSKNRCKHCGWEWVARVEKPVRCPRCVRLNWDATTPEANEHEEIQA